VATLTGFETYTVTSRSCAILPQIGGELHLICRALNWPFGRFAQIYAVSVSEIVRNLSRARVVVFKRMHARYKRPGDANARLVASMSESRPRSSLVRTAGQRFRVLAGLLISRRFRRKVTGSAGQVPPSRLRKPASNGRLRQFRRSRLIAERRNPYLSLRISLPNAS
jgi:hypothetical protein